MIVEFLSVVLLLSSPQEMPQASAPLAQASAHSEPDQAEQTQATPPDENETDEEGVEEASPSAAPPISAPTPPTKASAPAVALPANPLTVGNYRRDYEGPLSEAEIRYQSSINSGLNSAKSKNALEGSWELSIADAAPFVMFEFRQIDKVKSRIDGAWRALGAQPSHYGFLSDVTRFGNELEINFVQLNQDTPHILYLARINDDLWRGTMLAPDGSKQVVVLKRQSKAH